MKDSPVLTLEEKLSQRKMLKLHTIGSQSDILKELSGQAETHYRNEVLSLFEDRLPGGFILEKIEADFIAGTVKVYGKETAAQED